MLKRGEADTCRCGAGSRRGTGPALDDGVIAQRWDLFSRGASTSAGVEQAHNEILVLGNASGSASDLVIAHVVMKHAIDQAAVR
jgi:cyanuric acid amidohydrolase